MPSQDHVKEAMDTLMKMFKEDNLEIVARAVFKGNDVPSDKWSFLNRILMYLNNTQVVPILVPSSELLNILII